MTGIAPYTDNTRWWPGKDDAPTGSVRVVAGSVEWWRARAEAAEAEVERLTPRRDSAEIKFFVADAPHVVAAMKAAEDALAQAVAEVERLRAKLDAAREAWTHRDVSPAGSVWIGSPDVETIDAALSGEGVEP
jgi:hypothetical protein